MATKIVFNPLSGSFDFSYRPAIGDVVASGTASSVLFLGSSNQFAQDSHFTYDSTTDTLHVHAISGDATDGLKINADNGTQVGILGAGNTANVTWYGNHNFDAQTANTIAIFGASKTLSSADTTTYPSLTELTYLKGVTSAIQTQFTGKANTTLNNLGTTAINASLLFDADATYDIGSTTNGIDDLFLGSGGVINWANNAVSITGTAGNLAISASSGNVNVDIGNGANAAPSIRYFIGTGAGANGSFAWMADSGDTYQWGMIGYGKSHATLPNALTWYQFNNAAGSAVNSYRMIYTDAGNVSFGGQTVAATVAKFNILSTTEQLRVQYDTSNYYSTTVSSAGAVTFNAVGASAGFTFSDAVTVNGLLTLSAQNIATDTTTGMKIGTGTTQKIGFFNATPIVQQTTTSQTAATFVANTSGIVNDTATWGGYTIGDLVAILRAFGLLA